LYVEHEVQLLIELCSGQSFKFEHVGRGIFLWVSHALNTRGETPRSLKFLGPATYTHTVWPSMTKCGMVTCREGRVLTGFGAIYIPKEWHSSTHKFFVTSYTQLPDFAWWSLIKLDDRKIFTGLTMSPALEKIFAIQIWRVICYR